MGATRRNRSVIPALLVAIRLAPQARADRTISATDGSSTWLFELPELIIKGEPAAPIGGPQIVGLSVPMQAYRNQDNTPMAAITDELRATLS